MDTGDANDFVVEFDVPIKIGFAIREYDFDLEREGDENLITNFGKHSRFGYFEVVIPSSDTLSRGLATSTVYKPYYVTGATQLFATTLALLMVFYLF